MRHCRRRLLQSSGHPIPGLLCRQIFLWRPLQWLDPVDGPGYEHSERFRHGHFHAGRFEGWSGGQSLLSHPRRHWTGLESQRDIHRDTHANTHRGANAYSYAESYTHTHTFANTYPNRHSDSHGYRYCQQLPLLQQLQLPNGQQQPPRLPPHPTATATATVAPTPTATATATRYCYSHSLPFAFKSRFTNT